MSTIWFYLYVESNEQNKLTKWKQIHGYREQTNSYQMGEGWGLYEKVKGLSKEKKETLIGTNNSMVTARRKGMRKIGEDIAV